MIPYRKKLIEVALPLPEINDASAYDKMHGIGPHPKGIHHWWARLPLPTARAVLFASVVDDPSEHPERFPTEEAQNTERDRLFGIIRSLMGKKLHEQPKDSAAANAEIIRQCGGQLPIVFNLFAGGGTIPLEANRLGFESHGADLNPVAVLLNKCNLELAPRWTNSYQPAPPGDPCGVEDSARPIPRLGRSRNAVRNGRNVPPLRPRFSGHAGEIGNRAYPDQLGKGKMGVRILKETLRLQAGGPPRRRFYPKQLIQQTGNHTWL